MNNTEDFCLDEFTPGQFTRKREQTVDYRPTLAFSSWDEIHLADGLTIGSNQSYTFFDVDVKVGAGEQIVVNGGTLDAEGTRFLALDGSQGWGGIDYNAGSSGTIKNSFVAGVGYPACAGFLCLNAGWSVSLYNADVTLRDVTVQNAVEPFVEGVYASGSGTTLTMEDVSIFDMSGRGLHVTASADAYVYDSKIKDGDTDGIAVSGSARVIMRQTSTSGNSTVSLNDGRGVVTSSNGTVEFGETSSFPLNFYDGYVKVEANAGGGLLAQSNSTLQAGTGLSGRFNTIKENIAFQSRAAGSGASLSVNADYWGQGNGPSVSTQNGGTAYVDTHCINEPVFGQGCTLTSGSQDLHGGGTGDPQARMSGNASSRQGEGAESSLSSAALARATDLRADGQEQAAVAQLRTVVRRAAASPEATAALGMLARWTSDLGAAAQRSALDVIEGETAHRNAVQRWAALEAQAWVKSSLGDTEAALAAADALASDVASTPIVAEASLVEADARLAGPAARFWTLLAAERFTEAEAALGVMETTDATHAGTEMARRALRSASGEQAGEAGGRIGIATAEAPQATSSATPKQAGLGVPFPNPTTGALAVPLHLNVDADVTVAVYDVLGRVVVVLADGWTEAGRHTLAFETAALPGGLYVVRAEGVMGESVHTFTVAR